MAIAIGLLKTLLELTRSRKSGALSITGGGTRARVFVEEGTVVYAEEGTIGETLGRILVREKVLTDAQYNAALERMEALTKKGNKARLGEILVEMKFLTPVQLDAALSAQVRQKVIRAIGWGTSTFRFVECHGALDLAARFATPLEPLVLAALRLAPEEHVEELLDLALTRYPELRGDGTPTGGSIRRETLRRVAAFELQTAEHDFALALDGSRTAADILASTSDVNPTVVLALLLLTDCLDLHGTARPAKTTSPPPAAITRPVMQPAAAPGKLRPIRSVSPSTGMKAVRPGAKPILKKKAPSSVRPPAPSDLEQARNVTARLKQATEAKRSLPPAPSESASEVEPVTPKSAKVGELALWSGAGEQGPSTPVAPVNRILAEKAFQAGKAFVRANNMKDAAAELARAAALFPAIEYELWATWTAMRADKEGEAKHVPAVKALAEKAIEQDPSLGFAYFALGHLALRSRDAVRARELFAKARALDPATSDEAKDVRLTNASKKEGDDARPSSDAIATAAAAEAPPSSRKIAAATEEHGPTTRPSATRLAAASASSDAQESDDRPPAADRSSTTALATEATPPASSPGAAAPMRRRNMFIALGAAAVLASLVTIIATRKNDASPTSGVTTSPPSATTAIVSSVPPPASAATSPVPSGSAAADPNAISLDDEEDAAPSAVDASTSSTTDASKPANPSAPDTKPDVSTFPAATENLARDQ